MKQIKLFALFLFVAVSCTHDDPEIDLAKSIKLFSEEYFQLDTGTALSDDFVPLFKKNYRYEQDRLTQTDIQEYNPNTRSYESGYTYEQYQYSNDGKLSRKIKFVGTSGIRWVEDYEYLSTTSTKVTHYETNNGDSKSLEDWWLMERTSSSLTVKYYQLNDELYAQLTYSIDANGNVISLTEDPPSTVGKVYYKYDNMPNPYQFMELTGEYGSDSERYLSANNVVEVTNDSKTKSARVIEYNAHGYPVTITTPTTKRVLTYQ